MNIKMSHEEMKNAVIKAANDFYNGRETGLNDLIYDKMLELIKIDEPTFNIYDHVKYETDGIRVMHTIKFRDFNKVADMQEIDSKEKFEAFRKQYYILPKFDGSSLTLDLDDNGNITKILSRSDDVAGFLNTNKFRNQAEEAIKHRLKY